MNENYTIGNAGWSPDFRQVGTISTKELVKIFSFPSPSANYPTRTAQDLEIADLKRENNAAFQRIQELSAALFDLGYDPTARK